MAKIKAMIPDLDIWRSANLLVKRHGQDAPIHAAMRADAMLEAGEGVLGLVGVFGAIQRVRSRCTGAVGPP